MPQALFQGQRNNEEVVLFSHQHPFVLLKRVVISVLIFLIPFVANLFLPVDTAMAVIVVVCLVLGAANLGATYLHWINSLFLLTNERIVVLTHNGLFNREFSECGLHTIQQVSHEVKGILHTLAGYGTIQVVTGGTQRPFLIPNVPNPYDLQQEIQRLAVGEDYFQAGE